MCARKVQLLGPAQVLDDVDNVPRFRSQRTTALLGYLVTERRAVARDALVALFYPDEPTSKGRGNLRRELHNLGRILPDCWEINRRTVRFLPSPVTDVDLYELLAEEQAERWTSAAGLITGEFLEGIVFDDNAELAAWLQSERRRWRRRSTVILTRWAGQLSDERLYPAAIDVVERLLRLDPLQEGSYRRLMRLYALNGDAAGISAVYDRCVLMLRRELDVEPSSATVGLAERLAGRARRQSDLLANDSTRSDHGTATLPLVGRHREWQALLRHWQDVEGGRPHVVTVSGEAGIGKTRLVEELETWVERQGFNAAVARCYQGEEGLSYAPVVAWLRSTPVQGSLAALDDVWLIELSRLLPELRALRPSLAPPLPISQGWQRQQLFEAIAKAMLAAPLPLLLVLDDIQWCDGETLDWLRFLLHYAPESQLLIVATQRVEEVDPEHVLMRWRFEVQRGRQFAEVELGPLAEAEAIALGEATAGRQLDRGHQQVLVRETEGHPLFIVETVRSGTLRSLDEQASDNLLPASVGPHETRRFLPPTILSVIESRLNQLSPPSRELIGLAAVIGRDFSLDILAAVSDLEPASLVDSLEEALHRRILREQSTARYDFSHDRIREVAYASMSGTRRVLRHRLVADALRRRDKDALEAVSHDLAHHYERAGQIDEAVAFHAMAARRARHIFANETAIFHLSRGLNLLDTMPVTPQRDRIELDLQNELAPALVATKGIGAPELGETYARVRVLWQAMDLDSTHAPLLWAQTSYLNTRSELHEAQQLGERLLASAERRNDSGEIVMAIRGLGSTYAHQGKLAQSRQIFIRALDLYDPDEHRAIAHQLGNNPAIICLAFGMINLWLLGRNDDAVLWSERARDIARHERSPFSLVIAHNFDAWLRVCHREPEIALEAAKSALDLCEEHKLAQMLAMAQILCGWASAELGRPDDGTRLLRDGIDAWRATGSEVARPHWLGLLAENCLNAERYNEAASCLTEGLAIIKETGERRGEAELLRLQGMLLLAQSASRTEAEALFQRSLNVARIQGALAWELRTGLCLGGLWQDLGKEDAARNLVAGIYERFSQGLDTPDLQQARGFLKGQG